MLSPPSWDLDQVVLVFTSAALFGEGMPVFAVANQLQQTFTEKMFCLISRVEPLSFPTVSEV